LDFETSDHNKGSQLFEGLVRLSFFPTIASHKNPLNFLFSEAQKKIKNKRNETKKKNQFCRTNLVSLLLFSLSPFSSNEINHWIKMMARK
jgi:hypothetical protein